MKEAELRKHATCSICQQKVGAGGNITFCRVTIERFMVNMRAVQRQTGLAMMLGSAQLAHVMGQDEDMAVPIMDNLTLTVCEDCCSRSIRIYELAETVE